MNKKMLYVVLIVLLIISNILVGLFAYHEGVRYGVNETAKIYFEGFSETVDSLEVGEMSDIYELNGSEVGIDKEVEFMIVRAN